MVNEIKKLEKEKIKYISSGKWKDVAAICHNIGVELAKHGDYEKALEFHTEALQYSEMLNDRFEVAISNRMLGECFAEDNNFKKALSHIKIYMDIVVDLGNLVEEQRAWATFGRTYYMKYSYEQVHNDISCSKTLDLAEQSYVRALELSEDLKNELGEKDYSEMRARLLLNLGLVCEDRGNLSQCAKYIGKAIALTTKYNLLEDLNRCQISLANVYKKHGEYSHALHLYDGAIVSSERVQDIALTCDALVSKAYILTALKDFEGAKKILKKAYRLHTCIEEDYERIIKNLKLTIGLCEAQKKLQTLDADEYMEKKKMLEKIADTLSALEQYKLAIEFYLSTLKCIENTNVHALEMGPIYYSIAQTYYDDGNFEKACEYFEKEFNCNENKPLERIKTLWKIADISEEQDKHECREKVLIKAADIAEKMNNTKHLYYTLEKLKSLYEKISMTNKFNDIICKLNTINVEYFSSDEEIDVEENTENLFDDICISDILTSDSDEERDDRLKRSRRTKKPVTKVNEVGETPLHQACIKGNLNMVKKLIDAGQSINARDFSGWTPLHEACNHGWYDIVEYLIDKGADINDRGGKYCGGVTPLHDAACCGHLEIVKLLISKGSSVTIQNDDGENALQALVNWKASELKNLDTSTLKLCEIVENDLKAKMIQAGQFVENSSIVTNGYSSLKSVNGRNSCAVSSEETRTSEKRSRSPSLSPEIECYEDDFPSIHFGNEPRIDYDDAETAQAEYRAAISNLRRSAKSLPAVKVPVIQEKETSIPALLKETEVADEWLIKDTNEMPKVKRKRRRMNNLNIRTSKSISNYLISPQTAERSDESKFIVSDDDDNSNISCVSSDFNAQMNFEIGKIENNEATSSPAKKSELSSKQSFCVKVRISDKMILVPVPEEACNVEWLTEEAANRYQSLTGNRPHLILMTKDGALLLNTDLVQNIFSNKDEVLSSVQFWVQPSLNDLYEQLCAKHGVKALSSIKKRFQLFESSCKLDFSNCSIASSQLNLIFTSLSKCKTLQQLDISGTHITDDIINDFITCIPSFVSLVSLNMSCCCISTQSVKLLSEYLNSCDSASTFPCLETLNLSHNSFAPDSYLYFSVIFKLPSLINLNLSSCNLNSSFLSKNVGNCLKMCALQNFDISNNNLDSDGVTEFLLSIQKKTIRVLNLSQSVNVKIGLGHKLKTFLSEELPALEEIMLQGCYLTNEDLIHISSIFPLCPKLKVIDISANPNLSGEDIGNFILCAYEHRLNITKFISSGTFLWENTDIDLFGKIFAHKILSYLSTDKCPHDLCESLFNLWRNSWESKAMCLNNIFCELKIA